jgi:hypothetical protein
MARVLISDLDPRTAPPGTRPSLDLLTLDTPLHEALGLRPGDSVRIENGKGVIVRATGMVEAIEPPGVKCGE